MPTQVNADAGVILEINGEDVAIYPTQAITDAKKNGVKYELPRPVPIGTAEDLNAFLKTLSDDVPPLPKGDTFPSPLDTVYNKLISLNLAVEELTLKVPASLQADGKTAIDPPPATTFTLGLSATWKDNEKVVITDIAEFT